MKSFKVTLINPNFRAKKSCQVYISGTPGAPGTAPTTSDDNTQCFEKGDLWVIPATVLATSSVYCCSDNTTNNALWNKIDTT